jgi:hypothetical protein
MAWISLAQDKDRWWSLVNVEINLRVPYIRGIPSLAEDLVASQEGLWSKDLPNRSLCHLLPTNTS